MNDRLTIQAKLSGKLHVNEGLVDGFVRTVKDDHDNHHKGVDKSGLFVQSFRVLLEEHGLEPTDEPKYADFWEKVRQLAKSYHQPYGAGIKSLAQMETKAQLGTKVTQLVEEYYDLFCLPDEAEIRADSTIRNFRSQFGAREMHGIQNA